MTDDHVFDEESHRYSRGSVEYISVTQVLQATGFVDTTWFTEEGRFRGHAVHLACHYDDLGTLLPDSVHVDFQGYLDAYRKFKSDTGFSVEQSEVPLFDDLRFLAGTPDKVGTFRGKPRLSIVDIKTGAVAAWTGIQLSGYELLLARPVPVDRYGLALRPDGTYALVPFHDHTDCGIFKAALACAMWQKNHGRKI